MTKGRRFAVFDIDGTLIRWQLYHALTDELARQGHINPKSYEAMRDARLIWKKRKGGSFRDYELQVIKVYEAVLKTLDFNQFDEAVDAVFDEYKDQVYRYTRALIDQLKKDNYLLLAISGSQTEIVSKVSDYYGFDAYIGTIYHRADSRFSGEKTIAAHNKGESLKKLVAKYDASFDGSLAIGDSRSDAAMLEMVEHPIAFNPDADLFEIAQSKGWKVILERKNMIYELEKQGNTYELVKTN
jgi:HAD superfamily hydrolase (TIGR01490 family)